LVKTFLILNNSASFNRPQYDSDSEGTDEFVASEEEEHQQDSEGEDMFAEVRNWGADLIEDAEERRR
jgi:hypothetical protein